MSCRPLLLSLLAAPFVLTACGEGYEPVMTSEYFPYGNARTAGSGVAYVLVKMAPEKELKLETEMKIEPVEETKRIVDEIDAPEEVVVEPEMSGPPAPVEPTPMEEVFHDAQKK